VSGGIKERRLLFPGKQMPVYTKGTKVSIVRSFLYLCADQCSTDQIVIQLRLISFNSTDHVSFQNGIRKRRQNDRSR
jgi:hypothetical protein